MLIACDVCRRQYDVEDREVGSRVRCYCGELLPVERPPVRPAVMQRCSSCGARLVDGGPGCEYCASNVTLGERGWGEACPQCFARMVAGARYCNTCGIAIRPLELRPSEGGESCPVCERPLSACTGAGAAWLECTSCGGIWLDRDTFSEAVADREESGVAAAVADPGPTRKEPVVEGETRVVYRKCPVCGTIMNRKNFAGRSNVIIDRCRQHGVWFDAHELDRILEFVRTGGLERARQHEQIKRRLEEDFRDIRDESVGQMAARLGVSGGMFGKMRAFARDVGSHL